MVYLGRIPHGFYEEQMKTYFTQFGDVTRLRLSRNKKVRSHNTPQFLADADTFHPPIRLGVQNTTLSLSSIPLESQRSSRKRWTITFSWVTFSDAKSFPSRRRIQSCGLEQIRSSKRCLWRGSTAYRIIRFVSRTNPQVPLCFWLT